MFSNRNYLAVSIGVSLLFHLLLYKTVNGLPAFQEVSLSPKKKTPRRKPLTLNRIKLKKHILQKSISQKIKISLKENPQRLSDTLKSNNLNNPRIRLQPLRQPKPPKQLADAPTSKPDKASFELPTTVFHIPVTKAALTLPKKTGRGLRQNFQNLKLNSLSTRSTVGGLANNSSRGSGPVLQIGIKRSTPSILIPDLKFKTDHNRTPGRDLSTPKIIAEINKEKNPVKELELFLSIKPHVYIDEESKLGYFRLDLTPNHKAQNLKARPKDVLFIVDSSRSISNSQMRQFKKGINSGLKSLGPKDRFNIISFSTKRKPLFKEFTTAHPNSLEQAGSFLKRLKSIGRTDIYNAIRPYITNSKRDHNRPHLIYLLTDGVSTAGEIQENSRLIHEVTSKNTSNTSVFGFSCGTDINSFLMGFLAYRNRGSSLIVNNVSEAGKKLETYITEHSKIIASNLTYKYMGRNKKDLFPQKLPHLYQNKTLSLFGTFRLNEEESIIQILGNCTEGQKQLIYKINYAKAPRASRELAKEWADQKIFHLIGEFTDNPSLETLTEIRQLKQKFQTYIPFELPKLQK